MSIVDDAARKSAFYKIQLAQLGRTGNTLFVAQSAVDNELTELAGLSNSTAFPEGRLGDIRVIVVPDISFVTTDGFKGWRDLLVEKKK